MRLDDLRAAFWAERDTLHPWTSEMQVFLSLSAGLTFETRYHGEDRWWPVTADEVARTLSAYHANLQQCLDQLLEGDEIGSKLSLFRVAETRRHF